MNTNIPPPHKVPFKGAIIHPALYLWDAWSYCEGEELHLYCLAVGREDENGDILEPSARNSKPFHVRHFMSADNARTWSDRGVFQEPRLGENKFDSKTIWSGSVAVLPDARKLVAYTGLYNADSKHSFLQNIGLAISNDGYAIDRTFNQALSCPLRDWQEITDKGYYLDDVDSLGSNEGERGGPIMAWRDPFIFVDDKENIHLFWGAKVASHRSALAHALVEKTDKGFSLATLFPPVDMPDGDEFTQLELPKILYDKCDDNYYLIISTCNRLYEGQTDAEVDKKIRFYSSSALTGPWHPCGVNGSILVAEGSHMFGLTVLRADYKNGELLCISPYTDAADQSIGLTLSDSFSIKLHPQKVLRNAG